MASVADTGRGLAAVRAWKPTIAGIREVLHARFSEHAYPLHTHDTWTLFIVDDGAIRYDLDRHERGAEPTMVSILPPYVVHDGRPGAAGGYAKRVIYLEPQVLGEDLIGPAVDRSIIPQAGHELRRSVAALHDALRCIDDELEAETRLAVVADRIRAAYGAAGDQPAQEPRPSRDRALAEALRSILDARAFGSVSIAEAARELEVSPTRLARAFTGRFGIAPHAYVLGRRLDAARARILAGQPLADVAADVGFADQAHLTHRFRRFVGTTPGRFRGSGPHVHA